MDDETRQRLSRIERKVDIIGGIVVVAVVLAGGVWIARELGVAEAGTLIHVAFFAAWMIALFWLIHTFIHQ
jgi:hypothetical protein